MRAKVKATFSEVMLDRMLQALEQELLMASDEEVLEAAKELGMDPGMKGSAAFIGLKYPAMPRLEDFFDLPAIRELLQAPSGESSSTPPSRTRSDAKHPERASLPRVRKDPEEE